MLCGRGVHGIIKEFIQHHLEKEPDLEVHNHCTSEDLPGRMSGVEPDIVLLVVGIPREDDKAALTDVRTWFPHCPILAVSLSMHEDFAVKPLLEAGATRVIPAEEALDLPAVIREVAAGGLCAPPAEPAIVTSSP